MRTPLNYERNENDFYPTPAWVTEHLLYSVLFSRRLKVWEPFAGDGSMMDVIADFSPGFEVFGSDINPQREGILQSNIYQTEIVAIEEAQTQFHIITNPPYGRELPELVTLLKEFLCVVQNPPGAKLALLLNTQFITSKSGQEVCKDMDELLLLPRRIRWIENSKGAPRESHAWYVWSAGGIRDKTGLKLSTIKFAY
jgi:hypothetical protein